MILVRVWCKVSNFLLMHDQLVVLVFVVSGVHSTILFFEKESVVHAPLDISLGVFDKHLVVV